MSWDQLLGRQVTHDIVASGNQMSLRWLLKHPTLILAFLEMFIYFGDFPESYFFWLPEGNWMIYLSCKAPFFVFTKLALWHWHLKILKPRTKVRNKQLSSAHGSFRSCSAPRPWCRRAERSVPRWNMGGNMGSTWSGGNFPSHKMIEKITLW